MRIAIVILSAAILISPASAQIRGVAVGSAGVGIAGGTRGPSIPGVRPVGPGRFHQGGHGFGRSTVFLPYPYVYSEYGYEAENGPPARPVTVQAPATVQATTPVAPLEPLLIEWQGDRFVRMTLSQKAAASSERGPDYAEKPISASSVRGHKAAPAPPPRETPPAVLVFRDGRQEEVSSYTIMGGTIYSKADYWSSGSWTRKIQIAELDVPATLKLNQERGVKFTLPAGPNEVVMRP